MDSGGHPPRGGRHIGEFYAGLAGRGRLKPSFTFYRNVTGARGNYFSFSVADVRPLGRGVRLRMGLAAGLNNGQSIAVTTLSDVDLTVSLEIPWKGVTFSPFLVEMVGNRRLFGSHAAFGLTLSRADF